MRPFACALALFSAALLLDLSIAAAQPAGVEASVVKLSVTKREPDFFRPWTKASPTKVSGSGVVISGARILTNAHVVMNASEVFVQLRQGGDQFTAKVTAIAPGIDLALVELANPEGLKDVAPISLADELPQPKSQVSVYGYPTGGEDLSVTDGIVSRIEFTGYNFGTAGVRVQVDAALNPGNSGGPAIQEGKIVGLVFSGIKEAENIGYLIPTQEIQSFLTDAGDGRYDGTPLLFEGYQTAENDALRDYLKMTKEQTGVVVAEPHDDHEDYPLKKWDVITHVGPHAIDNQGFVDVRDGLRLKFLYYVPKLASEGKVELTILRDGKTQVVRVPVRADRDLLIPTLKDKYPEYFIYGPLVFSAATQEHMRALGGAGVSVLAALDSPLIKRLYDPPAEEGEQLVIIATRMFPHPITKGYDNRPMGVIAKVNGVDVKNLRHLAELLHDSTDEFIRLETADRNEQLIFRREELEESTEQILTDEGIRYQASESLRDLWEE
ncbi:MAG TPA: trypsin-like peptidase domain-containing protein [Lacipirellulaceae bacterium]|nr:trypsin-like peptidase domain-containing protein [Lacipirellulaceae bacterium]